MSLAQFLTIPAVLSIAIAHLAAPAAAAPCQNGRTHSSQRTVVRTAIGHAQPAVVHTIAFQEAKKDIVDTAVAAGSFKTLAAALGAADLVTTLKGEGPFTVFAPTDEAFAKLPPGTVETLLKPENKDKLKEILLLHVVPGQVYAADVVKLKEAKTAGGKTVSISTEGGVKVGTATGKANVVKTDIKAGNGVIHVIDAVILP
ncbi:hypothetical protein LBMAG47_29830 [Planctomycetia bacterium]|nr:hypothetical protein LBMAG47_29830 [Planctomycetia bacterium]